MELTVTVNGDSISDLANALAEVKRKVGERYRCGTDRNPTGRYNFNVEGEEVVAYGVRVGKSVRKKRYPSFLAALEAAGKTGQVGAFMPDGEWVQS